MEIEQQTSKKVCKIDGDGMEIDRLSSLPEHIIHHIISFLDFKYAVQTCVLSKKWKHSWTQIGSLKLDCTTFAKWTNFRKFVFRVFRHFKPFKLNRLEFHGRESLLVKILCFAKSHRVEELALSGLFIPNLPSMHFDGQTLLTLKLSSCSIDDLPDSFSFPSLTTLQLCYISSSTRRKSYNLLSNCPKLENLLIKTCLLPVTETFIVSGPQLVNLVIEKLLYKCMETKQKLVVYAPRLKSFDFDGNYSQTLSLDNSPALESANFHMRAYVDGQEKDWKDRIVGELVCFAERLSHAKSLKMWINFCWSFPRKYKSGPGKLIFSRSNLNAETEVIEVNEDEPLKLSRAETRAKNKELHVLEAEKKEIFEAIDALEGRVNSPQFQEFGQAELQNHMADIQRLKALVAGHYERSDRWKSLYSESDCK